ncbi:MAG: HAMP domain-containing protein [Dactylosporangium sp.]|nr:HAMP domain-containing protein [Dactylosporangium sp.]
MLLGTAGLAAGLGLGGLVLIAVMNHVIQESVTDDARRTGQEVARLVNAGEVPQPLPVSGGQLVQVVDDRHRVTSASANADRLVPFLRRPEMADARAGRVLVVDGSRAALVGPLRIIAVPAGDADHPQTVIVAGPLSDARTSVALLAQVLLVVYPLLVLVLAVVGWRVAGAALRPVETLRRGAERITGSGTEERLPVPSSRDEIHRLASTLNDMLGRLAGSRARQRAFVADAAHELRSPLASMRVQLEVAARLEDHGSLPEDLLAELDRLARLVDDLLLLARGDGTAAVERPEPIDLAELITEVRARYRTERVTVEATAAGRPWTSGDAGGLLRVITNLVDNAVRHADHRVSVIVREDRPYHVITVTDDGPGIAEADRERVFDRFTRLDDARTRDSGGSGLGLAIVRDIVRRHGGSVILGHAIWGMADSGLRVEVRLPRDEPGLR